VPSTVTEALERWGEVHAPEAIQTRKNGKWFDIVGRKFGAPRMPRPAMPSAACPRGEALACLDDEIPF
jgi:hypothetical protein